MPLFPNFATVNEISRHIEILLLSNDCVIVPGFGGFMAYDVDARKDSSDGSILPPIRSIGFNPKVTFNDSLLAQSYVEAYDISYPEAVKLLEHDTDELKQLISKNGSFEFNGIGIVSLNADGNYEFAPCEAGLLTPQLYGLGSFKIKTLEKIKTMLTESKAGFSLPGKALPSDLDKEEEKNEDNVQRSARLVALWRNIAVACIAAMLFILIPSPLVNNAQLAENHIDYQLLDKVMPQEMTEGHAAVKEAIESKSEKSKIAARQTEEDSLQVKQHSTSSSSKGRFSIVVASHVTRLNATSYQSNLSKRGFKDVFIHRGTHLKVLMGHYISREAAIKALNKLNDKEEFAGAWVIELNS